MKVLYRISPFLSSHPNPIGTDKWEIIIRALHSFLDAGEAQIDFICDSMPDPWVEMLEKHGEIIHAPHGNVETFYTQLDLACQLEDEDKVLICEDDYMWRPNTLETLERALDDLPFVSPYDHPSHYLEERFNKHYDTRLIDGFVYRRAPSNTLTFACKAKHIKENIGHMKAHGVADHEMWQGLELWNPTYSMATHLVTNLLAPNVSWYNII